MSAVQRVDPRTFHATSGGQLLAVAKRVHGSDRWAVALTDGSHQFVDGELLVRVFLGELDGARGDHPNGQRSEQPGCPGVKKFSSPSGETALWHCDLPLDHASPHSTDGHAWGPPNKPGGGRR